MGGQLQEAVMTAIKAALRSEPEVNTICSVSKR